ncbi:MAG: SdpI family protein [Solirubrobacteraceae bacterium]
MSAFGRNRDGSALPLAVAGTVMVAIGRLAAAGRLPRNPIAGIRIPSTMRDDAAWKAGHRAGAPALTAAGFGPLAAAAVVATTSPSLEARAALKRIDTGWVLAWLALATAQASRAARTQQSA